jgi:hypothetical protein
VGAKVYTFDTRSKNLKFCDLGNVERLEEAYSMGENRPQGNSMRIQGIVSDEE